MIWEIKDVNQKQKLKMEFLKVFKGVNPFNEVFNDTIVERLLIYPTDGYYLTHEQFRALLYAAKLVGDNEIYISEVESESDFFAENESDRSFQCKHWTVKNNARARVEVNQYYKLPIVLENAIYSPQGKWGIIISHEEHALLGGTYEFIMRYKSNYRKWSEDTEEFIEAWEKNKTLYNSNLDWLSILLSHIGQKC